MIRNFIRGNHGIRGRLPTIILGSGGKGKTNGVCKLHRIKRSWRTAWFLQQSPMVYGSEMMTPPDMIC